MNKRRRIFGIGLLVVLLLGGGYFYYYQRSGAAYVRGSMRVILPNTTLLRPSQTLGKWYQVRTDKVVAEVGYTNGMGSTVHFAKMSATLNYIPTNLDVSPSESFYAIEHVVNGAQVIEVYPTGASSLIATIQGSQGSWVTGELLIYTVFDTAQNVFALKSWNAYNRTTTTLSTAASPYTNLVASPDKTKLLYAQVTMRADGIPPTTSPFLYNVATKTTTQPFGSLPILEMNWLDTTRVIVKEEVVTSAEYATPKYYVSTLVGTPATVSLPRLTTSLDKVVLKNNILYFPYNGPDTTLDGVGTFTLGSSATTPTILLPASQSYLRGIDALFPSTTSNEIFVTSHRTLYGLGI